eukprot:2654858-Rhodomonas_salina.5
MSRATLLHCAAFCIDAAKDSGNKKPATATFGLLMISHTESASVMRQRTQVGRYKAGENRGGQKEPWQGMIRSVKSTCCTGSARCDLPALLSIVFLRTPVMGPPNRCKGQLVPVCTEWPKTRPFRGEGGSA